MKKLWTALLALAMIFQLTACQGSTGSAESPEQGDQTSSNKVVMTVTAEIITLDPQVNAGGGQYSTSEYLRGVGEN